MVPSFEAITARPTLIAFTKRLHYTGKGNRSGILHIAIVTF